MTSETPVVLVLMSDLFFLSRVRTAAAAHGALVEAIRKGDETLARARAIMPSLILIDMGGSEQWQAVLRDLKGDPATSGIPVVAFGPHVDHNSQAAARAHGADRILSNQRFTEILPQLFAQYLGTARP